MTIKDNILDIGQYSRPGVAITDVLALVVHWTAMPGQSPSGVRQFYESDEAKIQHYGSAHYGIGIDGEIQRWIPETEIAYHVGSSTPDPVSGKVYTNLARSLFPGYCGLNISPNHVTLGIECCIPDATGKFTPETIASLKELAADIITRHLIVPARLIRHWDVVGWKECPLYYVRNPEEWINFKHDIFSAISQEAL